MLTVTATPIDGKTVLVTVGELRLLFRDLATVDGAIEINLGGPKGLNIGVDQITEFNTIITCHGLKQQRG